jgi:hypothetical protein
MPPHHVDPPNMVMASQAPISMATLRMWLKRNMPLPSTAPAPRPRGTAHIWSSLSLWPTQLFTQQQVPTWNTGASSLMRKHSLYGTVQPQMSLADWPRVSAGALKDTMQFFYFPLGCHMKQNGDIWKICRRCATKKRRSPSIPIDGRREPHQIRRRCIHQVSRPHHVQVPLEQHINSQCQIYVLGC